MANVIKYDLLSDYHDSVILEKHLEEPRQSKDASSSKNQYILVTQAMKQFDSPLVLGREYVLRVCAPDDLSFTRVSVKTSLEIAVYYKSVTLFIRPLPTGVYLAQHLVVLWSQYFQ